MSHLEAYAEKAPDLSDSVVGIRIYRIGEFNDATAEQFCGNVEAVARFKEYIRGRLGDAAPEITVITNSDLAEVGNQVLADSGLGVTRADRAKAVRRARERGIAESEAKGKIISYADMLNSIDQVPGSPLSYIFASSDQVNRPKEFTDQIVGMRAVYDAWQAKSPGQIALVGSLVEGDVHDRGLVQAVISGTEDINLDNLSQLFPNNALSLVPAHTQFSECTDNGQLGEVKIDGKPEKIGGNEDFYYGFEAMLRQGKDCVLLIDPFMAGRQGEVMGIDSKYIRRKAVYGLYAKRLIDQAAGRKEIVLEDDETVGTIVEVMVDAHLFFARIDHSGRPEIILTKRQSEKGVELPF